MKKELLHPGYRAREKDVERLTRLNHNLCLMVERLKPNAPNWLIRDLDNMITETNHLFSPLENYRDLLPKFMMDE